MIIKRIKKQIKVNKCEKLPTLDFTAPDGTYPPEPYAKKPAPVYAGG
jgi:hypothetical protein